VFRRSGFPVYDFRDLTILGGSDAEFLDGVHISEKACLRILIGLAREEPKLRDLVDIAYLERLLHQSTDDLVVLPE
jgi:hypothetical protein